MASNKKEETMDEANAIASKYSEINFSEIDEDLASFQEDEMVQQALHRGVDLKKYGQELEKELRQAEMESVTLYVENSQEVIDLHNQMQSCDVVLTKMELMLHGFQADLVKISDEIKHLQDDSLSMSIRLKNRRAAEEKLHKFLENAIIQPNVNSNITSSTVNEAFQEAVLILSKRLKYLEQTTPAQDGSSLDVPPSDTFCGRTMLSDLEKLKIKSIGKIREYFFAQFNSIRKPKTNIQILQQNGLIKYAKLFQFVQKESPIVADDMRAFYIETMGRTIFNLFKSYYAQLIKLDQPMANKNDLIAVEEATLKSIFTQKIDMTKRNDTFALSDREKILVLVENEPITIHVALAENQKFPFELIFRSVLKHLIDSATNEFLFIIDFFKSNARDTFHKMFTRTTTLILESLEVYLQNCCDIVGLLIMIKMTNLLRLVMQRRRMPVLDSMFDRISLLLWPRFKHVFDANLKSIKNANARKLGPVELTAHYVTRRYAQLVTSIIALQSGGGSSLSSTTSTLASSSDVYSTDSSLGVGGGGENMLHYDMLQMRNEIIGLVERMAELVSNPKEKRVFFINNYDQMLSIFQDRRIVSEEVQKFNDLLMQQREYFAEEEIKYFFPRLVAFILQTEKQMIDSSMANKPMNVNIDESLVESLVREFASNWRTGIQQINDDVLSYFANFRNGMEILKQVLTQLLLYYTRFQDIIKKTWSKPPSFNRDIVSTATILMEIKRYSRTF